MSVINLLSKDVNRRLSENLETHEIKCKCSNERCNFTLFHDLTTYSFQKLRDRVGVPLNINSGYRCQTHNETVGGVPNSFHTVGLAVDIAIPEGFTIHELLEMAKLFFDVVIEYPDKNFIHCHNEV